jgi:hypothetical protein
VAGIVADRRIHISDAHCKLLGVFLLPLVLAVVCSGCTTPSTGTSAWPSPVPSPARYSPGADPQKVLDDAVRQAVRSPVSVVEVRYEIQDIPNSDRQLTTAGVDLILSADVVGDPAEIESICAEAAFRAQRAMWTTGVPLDLAMVDMGDESPQGDDLLTVQLTAKRAAGVAGLDWSMATAQRLRPLYHFYDYQPRNPANDGSYD